VARFPDARTRTAYHEAGHAVLSAAINDMPRHVSIRAMHDTLGRTGQKMFARPTSLAQVYLAGFASEHRFTGRRSNQFRVETGLGILAHTDPKLIATFPGVEASDGYGVVRNLLRIGILLDAAELRKEVDHFYRVAHECVVAVWPSVTVVANALLAREELDRDDLDDLLGQADIYAPVLAIQQKHGFFRAAQVLPATT
jgi:hypothetical protein